MNEENLSNSARNRNKVTESFMNFHQEIQRSEMLMSYLEVGNVLISNNTDEAKKYFNGIYDHIYNTEDAKDSLKLNLNSLLNIQSYEIHLSSMIYVNTVDSFNTYLKDILSEVVLAKPQVLRSKDTEKLDFILQFESMDELIYGIASKKVESLFYKGIKDIEKFFKERLNIELFKTDDEKENITIYMKLRNLTVHNRRKISRDFVKNFPEYRDSVGEHLNFDFKYVSRMNLMLFNFLGTIDEEIAEKFNLKMISLKI